jgi:hypothetical protein
MFKHTREPGGRLNYLMAGVACIILGGIAAGYAPILGLPGWMAGLPFLLLGLSLITAWWSRRREDRYRLDRLWEEPVPEDEPLEDSIADEGAPYCGWCDEAYAPGTYRCSRCGRELY